MSRRLLPGKPTITDIAELARVSPATVSLVLNNKGGVAESTREQILSLAKELNYVPNLVARSLVVRRSRAIGMMVPTVANALFPEIALGVDEVLKRNGYSLSLISTYDDPEREANEIVAAQARGVDGIITSSALLGSDSLCRLVESNFPVISLVRRVYGCPNLSYVNVDNLKGGFMAMEHLIRLGHRDIAVLQGPDIVSAMRERFAGHMLALRTYGLSPAQVRQGPSTRVFGTAATAELLSGTARPTAIAAANDEQALGVIDAAAAIGLNIGCDLALVGFNNIDIASLRPIALTTISQRSREMGRIAATQLIKEIESKRRPTHPYRQILAPELVVRGSCGFHRQGGYRLPAIPMPDEALTP